MTPMIVVLSILSSLIVSVHAQTTSTPTATTPPQTITSAPTATLPAGGPLPLTQYTFTYPNVPYQVNPYPVDRGPQSGYNICNSTTEGPSSQCQTMFVNNIEDFCIWGAPEPNSVIGNIEAIVVAYCTKPGHGTRLISPGILTAVQFIKTPSYIQVTGLLNQTGIGLTSDDAGGELDPHGADLAGNPLGGLVFSNNLPTSRDNNTYIQVNNWSNFVGSNQFCIKACDPTITSPDFCQNIYDTQGCAFNMPASYAPNEFTSCLGDDQAPPGGAPVIPATSSCTTYTSSLLYGPSSTAASSTTTRSSTITSSHPAVPTGSATSSGSITSLSKSAIFAVFFSVIMIVLTGTVVGL